jgi:chromosome segregation ATPase
MRRRHMATAIARFPAEVAKPTDIDVEILDSFRVRLMLPEAIGNQEQKRKEAELELAKTFVKENRNGVIDVEAAFQRYETWRVADERSAVRIAALMVLRKKVDQLIAKRTAENSEAVKAAFKKRIQEIQKTLDEKSEAASDLEDEKKLLEKEIEKLEKPLTGAASQVATAKRSTRAPTKKKRAAKK